MLIGFSFSVFFLLRIKVRKYLKIDLYFVVI